MTNFEKWRKQMPYSLFLMFAECFGRGVCPARDECTYTDCHAEIRQWASRPATVRRGRPTKIKITRKASQYNV